MFRKLGWRRILLTCAKFHLGNLMDANTPPLSLNSKLLLTVWGLSCSKQDLLCCGTWTL